MRFSKLFLLTSMAVGITACDQDAKPAASELAFLDSLHLATVTEPGLAQQTVSPLELGMMPGSMAVDSAAEAEAAPAPAAPRTQSKSTSSSTARRRSSSSGTYSSGTSTARQPRVVTVKNTKRDAAIGAVGGAVIGAVAGGPRHRVKGAVIGAVAGGVAGAVIGSTIDTSKRIEY